ncbi:acetate kinase [Tolumonas auensis DSM 9187]|uniref:Acetate kinase n=1 Tax=Tolumonas auensis (strain DSM 9187 / NBRC 110442 / TA 4) TaxID=595494 RepID=C4LFY2_TOLAT|nr:acetate kinase [Tolumonas auensis]ACQ93499.1 acetate kinase [Tolumonas auensis DSM 9187]
MNQKLVLVLNCGSSSLKFAVLNAASGEEKLSGLAECLHLDEARIKWKLHGGKGNADLCVKAAHQEALDFIVQKILPCDPDLAHNLIAVGHRIVHGGEKFTHSVLIDENVVKGIEECSSLAPLHNPAHLVGIRAAQHAFPALPNVAVFDTAFHQTMPEQAYLYALPYKLYKENAIRRYGMHGTSHYYISLKTAELLNKPVEDLNIISCHLGNGGSVCAIKGGKSVDTSMGLTPLEGLVMGTRCGDIDPAIIFHMHDALGMSLNDIHHVLTKESGLLGLTEVTSDCRYIEDNYETKKEAKRAMDIYCYRLAKYIAGYTAALDGHLDAVVFTGGIGENSAPIRELTLNRLSLMGFKVDHKANLAARFGKQGIITEDGSTCAMVIPTNEEWIIAQDAANIVNVE